MKCGPRAELLIVDKADRLKTPTLEQSATTRSRRKTTAAPRTSGPGREREQPVRPGGHSLPSGLAAAGHDRAARRGVGPALGWSVRVCTRLLRALFARHDA